MGAIRDFWDSDSAVSEVIGTILLIAITVSLIGGLTAVVLSLDPPPNELHADLSIQAARGPDNAWNTGDEEIRLSHLSGEPVPAQGLSVQLDIEGTLSVYAGTFTGALADGELTLGETWIVTTTVDEGAQVSINIVYDSGRQSQLVYSASFGSANPCDLDSQPPSVSIWGQSPADLTALSTGDVTVTISVVDNCGVLSPSMVPHLHYRINDGTAPVFTDLGAMTALGGDQWSLAIPQPTPLNWAGNQGDILEYYVSGLLDNVGNSATSNTRTDLIGIVGGTTFTDAFLANKGTLVNFGNAQNDGDAGASATLTQNAGAPPVSIYGTSSSKSGGSGPHANARGAPDDQYYTLNGGGDFVTVGTYTNTGTGTITKVEMVFEGHYESVLVDDRMDLRAKVPGGAIVTTLNDFVPNYLTDTQFVVDITSLDLSGSWTWAEVANTELTVLYEAKGVGDDPLLLQVDSLFMRVSTSGAGPEMDIELEFPPLPASISHTLELNYRVTQDTFTVQVWDGTTWNTRGAPLDQVLLTTWTYTLTGAEQTGDTDSPLIRIVGTSGAAAVPGTVVLDYAKVEST